MYDDFVAGVKLKLSTLDSEAIKHLATAATLDFQDHFRYQTVQSVAFASGRITQDAAQWLYATLGSTPEVFNRRDLATRIVAIKMIGAITEAI